MSVRTVARPSARLDPRTAAHGVLEDVEAGAYAERAAEVRLAALDPRDRALAREIAYGCLRLRARLDTELTALVDRPLHGLQPSILQWLRIGLYQIRELRVPDHAAVFETVERTRAAVGRGGAGLVNAVLRAAARADRTDFFPSQERDPVGYLATYGSHPEWLLRRWLAAWPQERVERLVELDNRPPGVVVRLIARGGCAEIAAAAGSGFRLEPTPGFPRSCRLLEGRPADLLDRVPAIVQDPAASAVVDYCGSDLPGPVLDLCAAPGGKAIGLAAGAREPVLAADISPDRLRRVAEAAARLGLDVQCVAMDARRPAVALAGTILLDAPCSGTGVLRRRPDARWRLSAGRLRDLVRLQRELLEAAAPLVRPGGLLVYATCSLEPEENEDQVARFLESQPAFEREPPRDRSLLPPGSVTHVGDLSIHPATFGTDGSFAARLRHREAA